MTTNLYKSEHFGRNPYSIQHYLRQNASILLVDFEEWEAGRIVTNKSGRNLAKDEENIQGKKQFLKQVDVVSSSSN